jgi:menaquinone-9 beta-reductase
MSLADVFVIGGGPAGLAAAIAARQRGFTVTVADCARPPIDKACGEGMMPDGVAAARVLGVNVEEAGQPFPGIRFCEGAESVQARFPHGQGFGLRRTALHQLLLDRASDAGVQMHWGERVGLFEDIRARWIIGADGGRSAVRRWAGLDASVHDTHRFGFRREYRLRPWTEFMEVHWDGACELFVTPVADNEICVVLISGDPALRLDDALPRFPDVARQLAGAQATTERGGISASRRFERIAAGRVALIGDASGSVDAVTGEGLCLLFQQAGALAAALEAGDLSRYQREHRRIGRRAEFMANVMLLLDGHQKLRRRAIRTMSSCPQLFARMLAMHVGDFAAAFGWRTAES